MVASSTRHDEVTLGAAVSPTEVHHAPNELSGGRTTGDVGGMARVLKANDLDRGMDLRGWAYRCNHRHARFIGAYIDSHRDSQILWRISKPVNQLKHLTMVCRLDAQLERSSPMNALSHGNHQLHRIDLAATSGS